MDYTIAPIDQQELVRIRRELHMYPELRWDLDRTAALVRRELDAAGIAYGADKYGRNTVVATINPQKTAFTIGIHADMDALPIPENNHDKPYRSKNAGVMHACGHDAHTAMLIGTAKALYAIRDQLSCRVKLLFQPCEESRPSGARTMCEHGVMKDIDCIIMCHVNCVDETHVISSNPGVTNSSSVAFTVTLGGKSVHVASPHAGIDALAAGVKIYNGIQMLVSREVDPFDTCVMSVTCMQAGETVAANADKCVMKGSIRCLHDRTMAWARARLEELVRLTAEHSRTTWALEWSGSRCPARTTIRRCTRRLPLLRARLWAIRRSSCWRRRRARRTLPITRRKSRVCSSDLACAMRRRAAAIRRTTRTGTSTRTRSRRASRSLCSLCWTT